MKSFLLWLLPALAVAFQSCTDSDLGGNRAPNTSGDPDWLIPKNEVFDGGPGKDGIPALTSPNMVSAQSVTYLTDDDLVLGYKLGDDVRAYPHDILDWHEIINDEVDGNPIAVIYCPLTGTGTGWERTLKGTVTTFGVSGLLYNTNVIPYDRLTNSNWSQMRMECVNGELKGTKPQPVQLVETTWKTWKEMFPESKVVSLQTGFNRSYGVYPYGFYKTNNDIFLFPYTPKDSRLPNKERVLGVVVEGDAKIYRFDSFDVSLGIVNDNFRGIELVIAGSKENNFLVAFEAKLADGTLAEFSAFTGAPGISAEILTDTEGNTWNIFGEAVSGPRKGEKLKQVTSFIGYWFSWGAFYPEAPIFGMKCC
jgi:hypothetical protein